MVQNPIEAPMPTLDARWIIALWVAIHGNRAAAEAGGELALDAGTVRAAAGSAILALATQLDAGTARQIAVALERMPRAADAQSEAELEESLKRLGIRLTEAGGIAVAGFGKICWR